jgi:hypothetical protein
VNRELLVLSELGRELERAAAGLRAGRRRRGLPRRHVGLLVAAIALIAAAVATATVLLVRQGAPLPSPHAQDLRSGGIPLAGSARLAGLDAPDPDSASAPWDLRLSRTESGEICTAVGQVVNGEFGIVGLDDVFRPLPLGGVDACSAVSPGLPVLAGARAFLGRSPKEGRTVVSGVAGAEARKVVAYGEGPPRALQLGPQGSFITVYAGPPESVRPTVVVTFADGHRHTISFERSSPYEVADPGGGAPWLVSSEPDLQRNASPDEDCAQAVQEATQEQPGLGMRPLTPSVCAHLSGQPLFVMMRRFVPGGGEGSGYPWGNAPARTLVYGVAGPRVSSLTLGGGGGAARRIAIDRHGGAFLAVLDGHVDPGALTLTARLAGGASREYRRSTPLLDAGTNRPLPEPAVPSYREPAPATRQQLPPFELPIEWTARETLRSRDPINGRTWVLRSWQGQPNAHVSGVQPRQGRFVCIALGILDHGRLVSPSSDPSVHSPSVLSEEGRCDQPAQIERMRYMLQMESFVADPYAYAPVPGRVVLSGFLPAGASEATLLGAGRPRPLTLDANGAFLVVLAGRDWGASPHISYTLHGHRIGRGPAARFPLGSSPRTPQVRAPDPAGAAPWGFAASRDCHTALGRVVQGQLASLDVQSGVLKTGGSMTGFSASCITHEGAGMPYPRRGEEVEFDVQQAETYLPLRGSPALTEPEIEQRTLPGRTLITGVALPGVASVTISTPTDVRTLRPSGPLHEILAVYEGFFLRGRITAKVTLRDGRTLTQTLNAPGAGAPEPPSGATAADRIAASRRQIAAVLAALGRYRARHETKRARATVSFLALMRGYMQVAERRIRYQQTHPGVLPPE